MTKKTIHIKGMHCTSCAFLIEGELEDIGVTAKASYQKGSVDVDYDPEKTKDEDIRKAIQKAGYTPIVV